MLPLKEVEAGVDVVLSMRVESVVKLFFRSLRNNRRTSTCDISF